MDTRVNNLETLIGWVENLDSSNLARKWFYSNELRFAEYCEFHMWRKRERKSDYKKRYRVFGNTGKSGHLLLYRPGFWPGNMALSWLMLVTVQDIWTFVKVVLVSWSWAMLEAQDLWSHLIAFDVNLSLVDQQCLVNSFSWSELTVDEDSLKYLLV